LRRPIAVGGGVVLLHLTKPRRECAAVPGRRARELCPQLIFVEGHFKDYQRLGDAARVLDDSHRSSS
jgi:DNA polymerase-4